MPHVASALKNHAANRPLAARPAPASDRAPPAPFASLFDDNPPAPERPPQSAAADKGGRAARSDQARQPAKSTDSKAVKAKDDVKSTDVGEDAKNDAKTGKAGKTDQPPGDGKTDTDAKIADAKTTDKIGQPTDDKDAKPVSDGIVADALVAADIATAPASDLMPTIATAEAIVSVLAPTTGTVAPAAAAVDNEATVTMPAKADALAALQAATAKAGNDAALTAKAAAQPHGEAKPQGSAGDAADKDAIAHARGESAETAHHTATPHAQAALAAGAITAAPKAAADAAQPTALSVPSQTAATAGPPPAAGAPMPQPAAIPLAGVAFEIAGKALAGKNHFEIRLDPPELGRIEVRLEVDRDGNVISRMIADRADTLDLLRRDAGGLERALQDAGLKTSDNGLQFSLRDQSAQQQSDRASDIARLVVEDETLPAIDTTPRSYSRLAGLGSGVDIHV